jgi:hypothetical protein
MFSLTATASTSFVKESKFNSFSQEENKTTGINQAELNKFVENLKFQKNNQF